MHPTLTIFTPTFNRAHTLHLCYESLKRQTCKDFKWMIIDDGSTDGTKEIVEKWKKEDVVPIHYIFRPIWECTALIIPLIRSLIQN